MAPASTVSPTSPFEVRTSKVLPGMALPSASIGMARTTTTPPGGTSGGKYVTSTLSTTASGLPISTDGGGGIAATRGAVTAPPATATAPPPPPPPAPRDITGAESSHAWWIPATDALPEMGRSRGTVFSGAWIKLVAPVAPSEVLARTRTSVASLPALYWIWEMPLASVVTLAGSCPPPDSRVSDTSVLATG